MDREEENRRTRLAGALVLAMTAAAVVVGVYATHPAMPHNPVHLPLEQKLGVSIFLPEGWKFFTRDPQEEQYFLLRPTADGWASPENQSNAGVANLLGARRTGRAMFVELGAITSSIPDWQWTDCKGPPAACLEGVLASVSVNDRSPRPQLCGSLGVVKQRIVPWAWANSAKPIVMPSKVLRLDVQC